MKNKKEEPKKIKFNFYWIYAIIAVLFFGVQILNINTISETSWQEFNRKMLQNKEVEKIVVVNRDIAQIYIKKEFIKRDKHKDVSKKSFGNTINEGPHYFFQISSPDNLEEKLKELKLLNPKFIWLNTFFFLNRFHKNHHLLNLISQRQTSKASAFLWY